MLDSLVISQKVKQKGVATQYWHIYTPKCLGCALGPVHFRRGWWGGGGGGGTVFRTWGLRGCKLTEEAHKDIFVTRDGEELGLTCCVCVCVRKICETA